MNGPHKADVLSAFAGYSVRLQEVLRAGDWAPVERLANELLDCWKSGRQLFICGNGGSAGNAIHLANDFLYGISKVAGSGLRVIALPANAAVLTCMIQLRNTLQDDKQQLAARCVPANARVQCAIHSFVWSVYTPFVHGVWCHCVRLW